MSEIKHSNAFRRAWKKYLKATYSSCSSMPLSSKGFSCVSPVWLGKNSFSACSGRGVGVSKIKVSTIEPFELPKDTLWRQMKNTRVIIRSNWKLGHGASEIKKMKSNMQRILKVKFLQGILTILFLHDEWNRHFRWRNSAVFTETALNHASWTLKFIFTHKYINIILTRTKGNQNY